MSHLRENYLSHELRARKNFNEPRIRFCNKQQRPINRVKTRTNSVQDNEIESAQERRLMGQLAMVRHLAQTNIGTFKSKMYSNIPGFEVKLFEEGHFRYSFRVLTGYEHASELGAEHRN
jgi:hypothetical protein